MMTQPGEILATRYCAVCNTLIVNPCFFRVFFKYHFTLSSVLENDLYVNSPFSQKLDEEEGRKCQKSENSMQCFSFLSFFFARIGQRETEQFHLRVCNIRAGYSE